MKKMVSPFSWLRRRTLLIAAMGVALIPPSGQAWSWKAEPQPLLEGRTAIWSDADSPLAWDSSSRTLWHLSSGNLTAAYWRRGTFQRGTTNSTPQRQAGMLTDSALHFLYFVNERGIPCVRRAPSWTEERIGDLPVTRLLAVDSRRRGLFAYDAEAGGIRLFTYDARAKSWTSELIATGLGAAEEAGAFDPLGRVLYTTHETVDSALPRHAEARTVPDPTGIGAWKPWPLVATTWSSTGWTSRVLDETGVPQQPAVRLSDHRVFYAQRDEGDLIHFYQPARNLKPESFGSVAGWSGADTYVDHHYYEIRKPTYPWPTYPWFSSGSVTVITWPNINFPERVALQGPITIVPSYEPIWTDTPLPPRLTRFRALVNARQSRLVQQRLSATGESLRTQTGQRLAGYLYRDARGVLASSGTSSAAWGSASAQVYPVLGPGFDPAAPPAHFQDLASESVAFFAFKNDTTRATPWASSLATFSPSIRANFSTNADAPWVETYLRSPATVISRTFGHQYVSRTLDQAGGRYRSFTDASTSLAAPSQLAVDASTGATFYTQSTEPRSSTLSAIDLFRGYSTPPLAGFGREVEQKFIPTSQSVWIVMVY